MKFKLILSFWQLVCVWSSLSAMQFLEAAMLPKVVKLKILSKVLKFEILFEAGMIS